MPGPGQMMFLTLGSTDRGLELVGPFDSSLYRLSLPVAGDLGLRGFGDGGCVCLFCADGLRFFRDFPLDLSLLGIERDAEV